MSLSNTPETSNNSTFSGVKKRPSQQTKVLTMEELLQQVQSEASAQLTAKDPEPLHIVERSELPPPSWCNKPITPPSSTSPTSKKEARHHIRSSSFDSTSSSSSSHSSLEDVDDIDLGAGTGTTTTTTTTNSEDGPASPPHLESRLSRVELDRGRDSDVDIAGEFNYPLRVIKHSPGKRTSLSPSATTTITTTTNNTGGDKQEELFSPIRASSSSSSMDNGSPSSSSSSRRPSLLRDLTAMNAPRGKPKPKLKATSATTKGKGNQGIVASSSSNSRSSSSSNSNSSNGAGIPSGSGLGLDWNGMQTQYSFAPSSSSLTPTPPGVYNPFDMPAPAPQSPQKLRIGSGGPGTLLEKLISFYVRIGLPERIPQISSLINRFRTSHGVDGEAVLIKRLEKKYRPHKVDAYEDYLAKHPAMLLGTIKSKGIGASIYHPNYDPNISAFSVEGGFGVGSGVTKHSSAPHADTSSVNPFSAGFQRFDTTPSRSYGGGINFDKTIGASLGHRTYMSGGFSQQQAPQGDRYDKNDHGVHVPTTPRHRHILPDGKHSHHYYRATPPTFKGGL